MSADMYLKQELVDILESILYNVHVCAMKSDLAHTVHGSVSRVPSSEVWNEMMRVVFLATSLHKKLMLWLDVLVLFVTMYLSPNIGNRSF